MGGGKVRKWIFFFFFFFGLICMYNIHKVKKISNSPDLILKKKKGGKKKIFLNFFFGKRMGDEKFGAVKY